MYLTILTPLYNRLQYLDGIFECLKGQTRKDFQWLVIDDGSIVDSFAKFEEYKKIADFEIDYLRKDNGGKHTALNFSHKYIKGDAVLVLDNDDKLTCDAVESVLSLWEKHCDNKELGVISLSKGRDENTPFVVYPEEKISDHVTYRINSGLMGDCCEIVRSDVFREFPFPEFEGERFMDESHLWYNIGKKYKTLYVNKVVYIAEYLDDGLTNNVRKLLKKNPRSALNNQITALSCNINFKNKIKRTLLLVYYSKLLKIKRRDAAHSSGHKALTNLLWLPGCALYSYWERKY